MKLEIGPLLGVPKTMLVASMATVALVGLLAACGGGEPEELSFDLNIVERQLDAEVTDAKKNDTVTLNFSSDEAGDVHLHGYDIEKEVSPGEVTTMVFKAEFEGQFNITFHPVGEHGHDGDMGDMDHAECEVTSATDDPIPEVSITAEASDEPHHIDVVVETRNIDLDPEGDHWHLFVNGELNGMYVEPKVTFDTRNYGTPGQYQIMATLNDFDHCDYGVLAMTNVVLEGEEPTDMEDMDMDEEEEAEEVLIGSLEVNPR